MNLAILGSTGSIGRAALDVVENLRSQGFDINVTALTCGSNARLLEEQARRFGVKMAVCSKETDEAVAAAQSADTVLNAIVGSAGLAPSIAAVQSGATLALANKESLVCGGELLRPYIKQILPVDSEHSAIFQCLGEHNEYSKIILTASGGAFRDLSLAQLKTVTREQALHHPNWDMGAKVTVDSATMLNKGFEFIEALHLFGASPEQVEVVIHRQSILHSAVEFADGAVIAQLGVPDMKLPIQYALTYPLRKPLPSCVKPLSLTDVGSLSFEPVDESRYPLFALAKKAAVQGGNAGGRLNAASEIVFSRFMAGKLTFAEIPEATEKLYGAAAHRNSISLDILRDTEQEISEAAKQLEYI